MSKIIVTNLRDTVTDDALRQRFSEFGLVGECMVMKDQETGRSRGFGFVTFDSKREAHSAILGMNDFEFEDQKIGVYPLGSHTSDGKVAHESHAPSHGSRNPRGEDADIITHDLLSVPEAPLDHAPIEQPIESDADPAQLSGNKLISLNDEELADVLVILRPLTPAAINVVEYASNNRSEHIIFRDPLDPSDQSLDGDGPQILVTNDTSKGDTVSNVKRTADLALRMSSAGKLKYKRRGFIFGRGRSVADIVTNTDQGKRISNQHFRIHIEEPDILMFEDTSTNGTIVDGVLLKSRGKRFHERCILKQGSTISITGMHDTELIKFLVLVPSLISRPRRFYENLENFITECVRQEGPGDTSNDATLLSKVSVLDNRQMHHIGAEARLATISEGSKDHALVTLDHVGDFSQKSVHHQVQSGLDIDMQPSRPLGLPDDLIKATTSEPASRREASPKQDSDKALRPSRNAHSDLSHAPHQHTVETHKDDAGAPSSSGFINSYFSSTDSKPQTSIFDDQSRRRPSHPSTPPSSQGPGKPGVKHQVEQFGDSSLNDSETIYSVDSIPEDSASDYILAFAHRLTQDLRQSYGILDTSTIAPSYIDDIIRAFTWRLHGESCDPFQLETSFVLHKQRKKIVGVLVGNDAAQAASEMQSVDDEGSDGTSRQPFRKPVEDLSKWVSDVPTSDLFEAEQPPENTDTDESLLFQLADYEKFIHQSDAYRWLLSKIYQHERLSFGGSDIMGEIGASVLSLLRTQEPQLKMSRRRPLQWTRVRFLLDCNPSRLLFDLGLKPSSPDVLDKLLCVNGTWEPIKMVLKGLLSCNKDHDHVYIDKLPGMKYAYVHASILSAGSCAIAVTGGAYFVSEFAEQIAWVTATFQSLQQKSSVIACQPYISNICIDPISTGDPKVTTVVDCQFSVHLNATSEDPITDCGFCWGPFFDSQVLVTGFPTLRRTNTRTGLEISLGTIASLIGSNQVFHYDERIIIKGFDRLLTATLVTTSIVIWHLIASEIPGKRISYFDTKLDTLKMDLQVNGSLRGLEGARHIVGWCSKATDFCGHETANCSILPSGLQPSPSATIIDRMYIEGGMHIIGGINLRPNQKEQPVKLHRERDYPELLQMVAAHPVAFYDVEDRRAWLIDGASALLQLVRISLYLDATDPESPYEWVFDNRKLINTWNDCTGRIAALRLLKDWNLRNLPVYVKGQSTENGQMIQKFATFGDRIDKILSWLEIIIDRDVYLASQDGIKVSQTLDRRKSISGFDLVDIIKPLGPIGTRSAYFDSWGDGWVDFFHSTGVTTIFGKGFGDLIRPDSSDQVCTDWQSIPTGMDYMTTSISTLKMIREKRLKRSAPNLANTEWGSNILWTSPCHPFKPCDCVKRSATGKQKHLDPVQFLVLKRSWNLMTRKPKDANLVDMETLDERGAVVFANLTLFGQRFLPKNASQDKMSLSSAFNSESQPTTPSASASGTGQSPSSENITTPSEGSAAGEASEPDHTGKRKRTSRMKMVKKRLDRFGRK